MGDWWDIVENGQFVSLYQTVIYGDVPVCYIDIWWYIQTLLVCYIFDYHWWLIYQRVTGSVRSVCSQGALSVRCAMMPWPSGFSIGSMIGICGILWDTIGIDHQPNGLWFLKMGHTGIPLEMEWNIPFIMIYMIYTIYYGGIDHQPNWFENGVYPLKGILMTKPRFGGSQFQPIMETNLGSQWV